MKTMIRGWLGILMTLVAHGGAVGQGSRPDYTPIIAAFRDSIPPLMEAAGVPGLSIAVVDEHSVLWSEGFGHTDTNRAIPVTSTTLFSVQSMSKSFTAAAVLVAVQDGLVDLDIPIVAYLPEFTVNSRFEEHPERKITLRLLLSHHAGFTHEAPIGNNYDGDATSFERHVASISRTWLRFPVGQRYSYSNLGIDLAGYVLQVRSGMPFEQYVREKLLRPLGMASSTFHQREIARIPDRAIGHRSSPGAIPVEVPMIPAGGLYSSADDLARFVQLQLNGGRWQGEQLIEKRLLDEMWAIHDPNPRQTVGYGLGIASGLHLGARYLNHGGGGFGFLSHMRWYPRFGLGIVMLTNSATHPFQTSLPEGILDRFIEARWGELPTAARTSMPADPVPHEIAADRLDVLAGQYLYGSGGWMILVFHDGRLGTGPVERFRPFTFLSEEEAFTEYRGEPFYYRFVRNPDDSPARIERLYDATVLDYNFGPDDPSGPAKPEWERYVGTYQYRVFGRPAGTIEVAVRNGYLHLDHMRLTEHEPGLFFAPHGEALDVRSDVATWRNIRLERVVGDEEDPSES